MKKNVQWLVIFVFALLLLTGCKGSEQEMQKKNGESEDVSSKVEAFLKKETNQSSETTQLLTETDASETADTQSTESMTETEVTAWDELQGKMHENDCNIAMAFLARVVNGVTAAGIEDCADDACEHGFVLFRWGDLFEVPRQIEGRRVRCYPKDSPVLQGGE